MPTARAAGIREAAELDPAVKYGRARGWGADVQAVLAPVKHPSRCRDDALWAAEVAGLVDSAHTLRPAVRAALLSVLGSLAADPDQPAAQRSDALTLLDALGTSRVNG